MEGCKGDLGLAEGGVVEDGFVSEDLGSVSEPATGAGVGAILTMATVAMVLSVIQKVNLALVVLTLSPGLEAWAACFSRSR